MIIICSLKEVAMIIIYLTVISAHTNGSITLSCIHISQKCIVLNNVSGQFTFPINTPHLDNHIEDHLKMGFNMCSERVEQLEDVHIYYNNIASMHKCKVA